MIKQEMRVKSVLFFFFISSKAKSEHLNKTNPNRVKADLKQKIINCSLATGKRRIFF